MGPSATTAVRMIELKFTIRSGRLLSSGTKTLYNNPEKHPKAFDTPDGSWRQKWLYELNSLDPDNLKKNFKHDEDITYDEIACFKASSLLDAFAGGRADYVMVDVEGFDDSVVYSLDLGRHRPKLIAFESKVMQSVRPEALYDVVEFCSMRGIRRWGRSRRTTSACATTALPRRGVAPAAPPAEPKKPYCYPAPPAEPTKAPARTPTAPGTAWARPTRRMDNVAEWYLTNFRVRFAREDGSWFDPDIEDPGDAVSWLYRRRKRPRGGDDFCDRCDFC